MRLLLLCFLLPLAFADLELVVCPDKVSACPDGTTCCPLGQDWGCCPIPNAVCCQDQRHCCPHDSVCDVSEGRCTQHSTGRHFPLHKKTAARRLDSDESSEGDDQLPVNWDGNAPDPDDASMKLQYPRQNASPRREPFRSQSQNDVECSDGKSKCPTGTTCCDLGHGRMGCCPVADAVCCEDHLHCCPPQTQCDVSEGRCINTLTDEPSPWYRKFSATRVVRKAGVSLSPSTRPCNGGLCRGDESCCESPSFRAIPQCCRFPEGVCCSDGRCCPKGYRCHRDGCMADSDGITVTAPAAPIRRGTYTFDSEESDATITCPDDSECPKDNTCCPVDKDRDDAPTTYNCCPLAYGNCCESVCCPRGYHCSNGNRCERRALTKELLKDLLFN